MTATTASASLRERFITRVREVLGDEQFNKYLGSAARFRVAEGAGDVDVLTPSAFSAEWMRRRFGDTMRRAAGEVLENTGATVRFCASPEAFDQETLAPPVADAPAPVRPAPARVREAESARRLSTLRHRLDNFIVGDANRLAHTAALRLIEDAPQAGVSPLFIHGACGLGKTHLLQGIAARFLEGRPGARVLYTTGEAFTNAFIMAVRSNKVDEFRRRHRLLDL
ncbi:MAG: DnaA ATPase domain-containing protein, partial [Phycisphaerales bacterium]